MNYPLYDIPYLVKDANTPYINAERHAKEVLRQQVVDDYFLARSEGRTATEAADEVTNKHRLTPRRFHSMLVLFYREAKKQKKDTFFEKYPPSKEQIGWF